MLKNIQQANAFTQETFGKTFAEMGKLTSPSNSNYNNQVANDILTDLNDKLFRQIVVDNFKFTSEITTMFMVEGLNVSDGEEILENKLIGNKDYDPTKFVPEVQSLTNQLKMFIKTKDKKIWELDITREVISKAFTNIPAFNQFVQNYLAQIEKSFTLYLYNVINEDISQNVKVAYVPKVVEPTSDPDGYTKLQQSIVQWFNELEKATDIPTSAYNLDGRSRKISETSADRMVFLVSPTTKNNLITKTLPKLFNEKFLNADAKLRLIKINGIPDNQVIGINRDGYRIFKRINEMGNQYFLRNITIYWAMHVWLTRGVVNWTTGFKYTLNDGTIPFTELGYSGTPNLSGGTYKGVEVNIKAENLGSTQTYTLGDKDWIMIRILDENSNIIRDNLFNKNGDGSAGPDDIEPINVSYNTLTSFVLDSGGATSIIAPDTTIFATGLSGGVKYQLQVFGWLGDSIAISSTSNLPVVAPTSLRSIEPKGIIEKGKELKIGIKQIEKTEDQIVAEMMRGAKGYFTPKTKTETKTKTKK